MSTLETPDPFISLYAFEKMQNPDRRLVLKAFRERDVQFVDRLVELSKQTDGTCKKTKDWDIDREVFSYFATRWPHEYQDFKKSVDLIRATRRAGGYSQDKEMKYVGALPRRFERLLKTVFPNQPMDKAFFNTLVKKITVLKVGGEKN